MFYYIKIKNCINKCYKLNCSTLHVFNQISCYSILFFVLYKNWQGWSDFTVTAWASAYRGSSTIQWCQPSLKNSEISELVNFSEVFMNIDLAGKFFNTALPTDIRRNINRRYINSSIIYNVCNVKELNIYNIKMT